ncbi:MAG: glycosyltransferase family 4 protein, partial [Chlamydiia bacterium]|nr:glycosyltransferase family 4 protein [Chlamydiia bacterium]
ARIMSQAIREYEPGVVFVNDLKLLGTAPVVEAQKYAPTVMIVHDLHSLSFVLKKEAGPKGAIKNLYRHFSYMLADFQLDYGLFVSNVIRQRLDPSIPYAHSRVVGVGINPPYGLIDQVKSQAKAMPTETKTLLYLGRVEPEKGVHTSIEALGQLRRANPGLEVRLQIAGICRNEEYMRRLKALCSEQGLEPFVEFLGTVDEEEKYRLMTRADVFLFPSTWLEGHGQTYLEAMACGTPCIACAAGGAAEVLVDEENCLLFEGGDADSMAHALHRLLADPALYEHLARVGEALVKERFLSERFAERCEAALAESIQLYSQR